MAEMKEQLEVQVAERTSELTKQKEELEHTLNELKSTQSQLIQAEKMASLGELTAGIAHEIQNPLNFVNNFSEVNNELIEELKGELSKGGEQRDKNLEEDLLRDISQNLEKINYHGKRADAIVKGMLQHSRVSTGQKDPTDINALADEYLRLSYHGLRAKNKNFNATIKTDFDTKIGEMMIVAQDMGRVLLNLINNAFYAVNEKFQRLKDSGSYEPTVSVSTRKINQSVQITVQDNGNGMPAELRDKIFQPFFTTKPAGEGTGLGLSITYDIIKAHGGDIAVESSQGVGSKFIITLPIK
jgi:signal transduction histidine kinase